MLRSPATVLKLLRWRGDGVQAQGGADGRLLSPTFRLGSRILALPWAVRSNAAEERWLTTGLSAEGRVIIVWHTNRAEATRIIGARRTKPSERRIYESGE